MSQVRSRIEKKKRERKEITANSFTLDPKPFPLMGWKKWLDYDKGQKEL